MNAPVKVSPPANVYAKIAAVQGQLAKVGISKSRRNQQQGYNFRGIDEVYAALSPLLAEYGLVIVPRVISRECIEGQTRKGDPLFRVTVHAQFDFVSADDGSIHTAATFGEAMDSADKATNKAMSAAYKYAAFMTFAIPTEGDNDADASHHEVAVRAAVGQSQGGAVSQQQPITDEQVVKLQMLLQATASNVKAFCDYFKVAKVEQLPANAFGRAVELLENKLAEAAKAETAAKAKENV